MSKLTYEELHGIWAGLPLPWDEDDNLDVDAYVTNIQRMCQAGVHGVYTTGSTGEFYALSFDEFKQMVDIQADVCGRNNMPLEIGCVADNTRDVLRYLEYVAGKPEVGAAQVAIPYWMEVSDRELLQYFKDIYSAYPDLPLVHYNVPRTKRFLTGPDYLRVLEVAPTLIGVKFTYASTHFVDLQKALLMTPQISYFVGENLMASAMMLGARGCCSSVIYTNPEFMLTMYGHAAAGRWQEAIEMQQLAQRFFTDASELINARGEGSPDPAFDKGMGVAAGCLAGSQRTRAPYIGWSNETVLAFRKLLKDSYPMLIYPE